MCTAISKLLFAFVLSNITRNTIFVRSSKIFQGNFLNNSSQKVIIHAKVAKLQDLFKFIFLQRYLHLCKNYFHRKIERINVGRILFMFIEQGLTEIICWTVQNKLNFSSFKVLSTNCHHNSHVPGYIFGFRYVPDQHKAVFVTDLLWKC